jgi:hypothetical protein
MDDIVKRILRMVWIPLAVVLVGGLVAGTYHVEGDITISFIPQILIFSPLITVFLLDLFRALCERVDPRDVKKLSIVLHFALGYFLVGVGIHYAANEISSILTSTVPLAYLLDEILGHLVMYFGGVAVFAVLFITEHSRPYGKKISRFDVMCLVLTGAIFGTITGYAFVEGQTPYMGYLFEPILAVLFPLIVRRGKTRFTQVPLTLLVMVTVVSGFAFSMVYGIMFPGWPQPSELF